MKDNVIAVQAKALKATHKAIQEIRADIDILKHLVFLLVQRTPNPQALLNDFVYMRDNCLQESRGEGPEFDQLFERRFQAHVELVEALVKKAHEASDKAP